MASHLYIHIGLHKTASTTIQAFLARNTRRLSRLGIMYPEAPRGRGPGHVNLTWELGGDRRFAADRGRWADIAALAGGGDGAKIVISAEGLGMLRPVRVAELGRLIAPVDPTIIVYLRPQETMIQSVYAQHCRDGRTVLSFDDFVAAEGSGRRYRYADLLDPWSEVFGKGALRVRILEDLQLIGGSVLHDFMDAIDEPPEIVSEFDPVPDQNRSPDGAALETLRRLAFLQQQSGSFDRERFVETVGASVRQAALQLDLPRIRLMTDSEAAAFRSRFADQNETVARRYLARPDGLLFTPVSTVPHAARRQPPLSVDYLLALLDTVIARSAS